MLHIHKRAKLIALKGGVRGGEERKWGKGKEGRRRTTATGTVAAAMNTSNTERVRRRSSRVVSRLGVLSVSRLASSPSCKTTIHVEDGNENDELDAKRLVAGLVSCTPTEGEMGRIQGGTVDSETTTGGTTSTLQGLQTSSSHQTTGFSNPLQALFETLDGVVCMYKSRLQPCALSLARKAVEDSCGKGFNCKELANLVAIYPDAYHLTASTTSLREGGDCDIIIEMGPGGRDTSRKIGLVHSGGSLLMRRKEEFSQNVPYVQQFPLGTVVVDCLHLTRLLLLIRVRFKAVLEEHCHCDMNKGKGQDIQWCDCLPRGELPHLRRCISVQEKSAHWRQHLPSVLEHSRQRDSNGPSHGGIVGIRERLKAKAAKAAAGMKSEVEKEADKLRRCNLPAVADALHSYFSNKLPPHQAYLTEVAKEISRTSRGYVSEADMRDRVRKLSHVVPEWCIVTDNSHHDASKFGSSYGEMGRPPPTMRRLLSRAQPPIVKLNHSLRYNEVRDILCFMVEEN